MEWPKLKNIILIILALTNLCLLVFVVQRELRDSQLQRQARREAIQFLQDRGVTVEEERVPQTMELRAQTVERDLEREQDLACALLGQEVSGEDRGAGVYRYSGTAGAIQFHSDGSFSAQFTAGAFPLGEGREERCLEILETLDFQGEIVERDADTLTVRQYWEGYPLFSQQVVLEMTEDCLMAMRSGRRLVGQPVADESQGTISVVTALIDFLNGLNALGDVCSRIDTISQGYVASASLSGTMTMTPVWRITTDTGAYQMNLLSGELGRVS